MSALTGYERFKRVQHKIERVAAVTAATTILIMGLLTTADVTMRFVFNSPIPETVLFCEFLMVGIVYFGIAYVQAYNGHVKMDVIVNRLHPRTALSIDFATHILALVIFSLATWQAGAVAWRAWIFQDYASGLLKVPFWPARTALTLGVGILCLRFIFDIIDDILKFRRVYRLTQEEGESR